MFRIRHKPTKKFIKKAGGAMWCTRSLINKGEIKRATSNGLGHAYNTREGAESFLKNIVPTLVNDFEIVEFKEM